MNVLGADTRHPSVCDGYTDVCPVCIISCTSLFYCAFVAQLR